MAVAARELGCASCGRRVRVLAEGAGVLRCCGTEMAPARGPRPRYATQRMDTASHASRTASLLDLDRLDRMGLFRLPALAGSEHNVELLGFKNGERTPADLVAEREVVFLVLDGAGVLTLDDRKIELRPGVAAAVEAGVKHALEAAPRRRLLVAAVSPK